MTQSIDAQLWSALRLPEHQDLVQRAVESPPGDLNALARLRKKFPKALVETALLLAAARRKAAAKFVDPDRLLCDPEGVEQASGTSVAAHKAERFVGDRAALDVCAGIGGDTMALRERVPLVRAVDLAPHRCVMVRHNAGVEALAEDAATVHVGADELLHIDPSRRRKSGRRLWNYADYEPGPEVVESLIGRVAGAAVKLGPGIDWRGLPDPEGREIEFIGDGRSLTQAVMWTGCLVRNAGQNTATRIERGETRSYAASGDGGDLEVDETPRGFLFVPDPSLERAGLLAARVCDEGAEAGLAELAPGLGILTGDRVWHDPWFEQHRILAAMSWRPGKIRSWLRAHDGGHVVVRTRAGAVPTDSAQSLFRGEGTTDYVLFGLRLDKRVVCFVTQPVAEDIPAKN